MQPKASKLRPEINGKCHANILGPILTIMLYSNEKINHGKGWLLTCMPKSFIIIDVDEDLKNSGRC